LRGAERRGKESEEVVMGARAVGFGLGATVLAAAGLYAWLPWATVSAAEAAIRDQDAAGLSSLMDVDRVSASVAAQAQSALLGGRPAQGAVPERAAQMFSFVTKAAVGQMLTPAGLGLALQARGMIGDGGLKRVEGDWTGLSTFELSVFGEQGPPMVFQLERQGMTFKLVGLTLPPLPGDRGGPPGGG
jgi:hypothetical protein